GPGGGPFLVPEPVSPGHDQTRVPAFPGSTGLRPRRVPAHPARLGPGVPSRLARRNRAAMTFTSSSSASVPSAGSSPWPRERASPPHRPPPVARCSDDLKILSVERYYDNHLYLRKLATGCPVTGGQSES